MTQRPKAPTDHLPKASRRITNTLIMDDAAADEYEEALRDRNSEKMEIEGSLPRRAAAVRAGLPAEMSSTQLDTAVADLRAKDEARLLPFEERLTKAIKALDKATLRVTCKALPRSEWKALKKAHPADDEDDQKKWEEAGGGETKPEFSIDSIARPLLKASIVEPVLSPKAVDEMFDGDDWNDAELAQVRNWALLVQGTWRPDPRAK